MSNDNGTSTIDPLELTDEEDQALGDAGKRALDRIRNAARENAEKAAKLPDLEEKLAKYERREAFETVGLDGLNEAQQEALMDRHSRLERELTAEELRQTAVELGYAEEESGEIAPPEEQDAHKKMASVAASDRAKQSTVITPDEVAKWPQDKQRRFMTQHRAQWDQLLRGEPVSGVVFT